MLAIIHEESIARLIIFFIVLFIACLFWVSYYRIRSFKLLLTAVAFTLLMIKPILHHMGYEGIQMHVLDIIVFSFIAVSFYRRRKHEDYIEGKDNGKPVEDVERKQENNILKIELNEDQRKNGGKEIEMSDDTIEMSDDTIEIGAGGIEKESIVTGEIFPEETETGLGMPSNETERIKEDQ